MTMILVLDTETTGLGLEEGTASILELALVRLPDMLPFESLVKPLHPTEIQALATHHITDDMLVDAPTLEEVYESSGIGAATHLVAHNSAFDSRFVRLDKPWVCTYRCARQLWPDAPGHSNQVLRYWLDGLNAEIHSTHNGQSIMKLPPHRAMPDAWVTAHILKRMLLERTIDELVDLTKAPILIQNCGFGKHRGVPWKDVPKDYLRWLICQDFDADTIHTAKHHLGVVA